MRFVKVLKERSLILLVKFVFFASSTEITDERTAFFEN